MKRSFLLLPLLCLITAGCGNNEAQDKKDYVSICVATQFLIEHSDREIVTTYTNEVEYNYYLTDIYYRIEFGDDIYQSKYISAFNIDNELIVKEVSTLLCE